MADQGHLSRHLNNCATCSSHAHSAFALGGGTGDFAWHHVAQLWSARSQEVIVLAASEARAATAEILEAHSIPAAVSKNMRDLLPAPATEAAGTPEPVAQSESASRTKEAGAAL